MKTKLLFWWDQLREKLWFIPTVFCIAAVILAVVALNVDRTFELGTEKLLPFLQTTGASGRIVLGALIGALVTVVGLAFSLTMLSVSQMSSQYGPRLVRTVFDSNITQYTLGLFLGTVVFCMIVLRTVRDNDSSGSLFTPHLSIMLAELAGALCLFALLAFTNHMTRCMRAETLVQGIFDDLQRSAEHLFPQILELSDSQMSNVSIQQWTELRDAVPLVSSGMGYLQVIELSGIVTQAAEEGHRLRLLKRPGEFIYKGTQIAEVETEKDTAVDGNKLKQLYGGFFLLGSVRTPRQDIEAGVLELVEAGVRALSPGVNDPMTAINVIDYLSAFLRDIAARQWPQNVLVDSAGIARVRAQPISFSSTLNAGFDQLRQYAGDSVAVNCRLLEGLAAIYAVSTNAEHREAILCQRDMIVRKTEKTIVEPNDLADIRERAGRQWPTSVANRSV